MADRQLRFTLDFLAKTAGLKNANELLDQLSSELGDGVDQGKAFAAAMRQIADRVEADLEQTAAVAARLADALGPEMAAAIGQSRIDNYAAQFRAAGMTIDDVSANVDELADGIKRLESTRPQIDSVAAGMDNVGSSTEKTGSVVANFAGNAIGELPGVGAAFGPLNQALGQFAEYATEGDISLGKFVKAAGGLAAVTAGFALLNAAIDSARRAQEEMRARTEEVVPALEKQISAAYQLAAATGELGESMSGVAVGADALNQAIITSGESGEKLVDAFGALGVSADYAVQSMSLFAVDPVAALRQLALAAGVSEEAATAFALAVNATDSDLENLSSSLDGAAASSDTTLKRFFGLEKNADRLAAQLASTASAAGMTDEQMRQIAFALEAVQDEAEKVDLNAITQQFLNNQYASNDAARGLIDLAEANLELSRADDPLAVYAEFNRLLGEASMATRDAVLGTDELGEALDAVKTSQEAFNRRMERQRDLLREAEEAQRDYTTAVLTAGTSLLDTLDAEDRFTEAVAAAAEATDDATTPVDEYAQAQRDAERAALDVAQSYVEMGKQLSLAAGKTLTAEEENQLLIEALTGVANTLAPGNTLRQRLDDYIYKLDSEVPSEVETEVSARYNMTLGKLGYADVNETGGIGSRFGPSFGSFVLNVNVTNPVLSGEQIAAELAAYLRRSGATFKLFGG